MHRCLIVISELICLLMPLSVFGQQDAIMLIADTMQSQITIQQDGITENADSVREYSIDEVTVTGAQSVAGREQAQMSAINLPLSQLYAVPSLLGEADVQRVVKLLPGVNSGDDGTTGLSVRGGSSDENLVMFDGVPIYNANHAMGLFSVFNVDALKNVTLYKGDFPARFGSRLSSVIDVRQRDGDMNVYKGSVTVGLLAAKVQAEGPIVKGKTTFNVSARRTYFDLYSTPLMRALLKDKGDAKHLSARYYFYDITAKLTHRFSEKDKLSGSFYIGNDGIRVHNDYEPNYIGQGHLTSNWTWGNILGVVSHEHRYNNKWTGTTQVSYSQYRYDLNHSTSHDLVIDSVLVRGEIRRNVQKYDQTSIYCSFIADLTAKTEYTFIASDRQEVRFGAEYTWHTFKPQISGAEVLTYKDSTKEEINNIKSGNLIYAHEAAVYAEDNWTPLVWLRLNVGVRLSLYAVDGKIYPSAEPRLSIRFLATKDLAIKASYAYMSQYIHLLSNSSVFLPSDLWVPVTAHIEPMRAMQTAVGLNYNILNQVELTFEGWYKGMHNVMEYREGSTYAGGATGWEEQVCLGDGWAYGLEVMLQRKTGNLTGWVAYTWSRSYRLFKREGQTINFGEPFRAKNDHEHDLTIALQYRINRLVDISATFIYCSGTRATLDIQQYRRYGWNTSSGRVLSGINVTEAEERNSFLMPDYHRLDIAANFHIPHHKWRNAEHLVGIGVYNVYNEMHPFMLYQDGNKKNMSVKLKKVTLFPIMPSISYTFKW